MATKSDLNNNNEENNIINKNFAELEKVAKKDNRKIFKISSVTGEGIDELMAYISKTLKEIPKEDLIEIKKSSDEKVYKLDETYENFKVEKDGKTFVVTGKRVEDLMRRVNIADYESLFYLHNKLDEIGVTKELKKLGVKDGDTVKIGTYEMEWED